MITQGLKRPFHVIGENIHTTRVVRREGQRAVPSPGGEESVRYSTTSRETRYLPIPEVFKSRRAYQDGRVMHVMVAIHLAMSGVEPAATEGMTYLRTLAERQVAAGADFLDLNVDEFSPNRDQQKAAMHWLVRFLEPLSPVPLSIDSSNQEVLLTGIQACQGRAGKPMLNSASLERIDALEIVKRYELPVVVTAWGAGSMPRNVEERVDHASQMVGAALAKGIPLERVYIDALVFPISAGSQFVLDCLDTFRCLRAKYGERVHLTGGISNVSFGMPCRRIINEVFLNLAVEAGADSGIMDPVATNLHRVFLSGQESKPYQLALDMLLGRDPGCMNFRDACREGGA